MQIVARGNAAPAVDKFLIGLTRSQLQLFDELPARQQSVGGSHLLQGPGHAGTAQHLVMHLTSKRLQRGQPGRLPVNGPIHRLHCGWLHQGSTSS